MKTDNEYLRQIRNALYFIALILFLIEFILVGIGGTLSRILGHVM
jgi:hypothetical protein